jgi:hypothetical protein
MTERVDTFIAPLGDHIPVDSYLCYSPDPATIAGLADLVSQNLLCSDDVTAIRA